jgi:hypothetical protein
VLALSVHARAPAYKIKISPAAADNLGAPQAGTLHRQDRWPLMRKRRASQTRELVNTRPEQLIAPLVLIAFIVLGILTVLNLSVGSSIQAILRSLENRLERWLKTAQCRLLGIERAAVPASEALCVNYFKSERPSDRTLPKPLVLMPRRRRSR